jgi:hypothetical protein
MSEYPRILKRTPRISLPARAVNRGPALFGANHGLSGSYPGQVPFEDITKDLREPRFWTVKGNSAVPR